MLDDLKKGCSIRSVAKKYGVSHDNVRRYRKAENEIRSQANNVKVRVDGAGRKKLHDEIEKEVLSFKKS